MNRFWQVLILSGLALPVAGDGLEAGDWILKIYHPSEPPQLLHISVEKDGDNFVFLDHDGDTLYERVHMVEGDIVFEHPVLEELCRLIRVGESSRWAGTCPPDNEPEFDEGLTMYLRAPKTNKQQEEKQHGDEVKKQEQQKEEGND